MTGKNANEAAAKLLSRLENVRPSGSGWSARCPAHHDLTNSLSIAAGDDGRALVYCHAGCDKADVLSALGMTMADLMSASNGNGNSATRPKIVATYDYCDEHGRLLFQVVRCAPKRFRQRQPKERGGWKWSVKGVRMVPYCLPEILADPPQPVVIVEGEKDCDNLAGSVCWQTCNAGGAGKWKPEHAVYLEGRDVFILPDNDDPGRKHAMQVAQSLNGIAKSIKIVNLPGLPVKGDVSDWLQAGGKKDELQRLVDARPPEWRSETLAHAPASPPQSEDDASTAERLVRLALDVFRFGRTEKTNCSLLPTMALNIAVMLKGSSQSLRAKLARIFRAKYGRTPNSSALVDGATVLTGEAQSGDSQQVALRLATNGDSIAIDLGDTEGRAVIVQPGSWKWL